MKKNLFKSMTSVIVAFLLLFAMTPAAFAADSDTAVDSTANPTLFAALKAAGKNPAGPNHFTVGELKNWTGDLDLSDKGIISIAGLENCVGISRLNLSGNGGLTSIAPLDGVTVTALTALALDDTNISALPSNLQMPALETLDLSGASITDAGLAGITTGNLPHLKNLSLARCANLDNITSLSAVTTLETLNLSEAGLTALPASLAGMTNLTELHIHGYLPENPTDPKGPKMLIAGFIDKVATLPKFKNANADMVTLDISNTDVNSASFLDSCYGLKMLVWEYQDSAPAVFPAAANLYYLDISNNAAVGNATLTSIATGMPLFSTFKPPSPAMLCINSTGVTDVSNLAPAAGIQALLWMNTPSLTEAKGLNSLTQLTSVDLSGDTGLGNAVLTKIASLPNIVSVGVMDCGITDLTALAGKTNLISLLIGENQITSLAPLSGMNLSMLYAQNNNIHSLAPISGMTNLTYVDVTQNYLDTTTGSPDRAILDTIAARTDSVVTYNPQHVQPPVLSADSSLTGLTASQPMTPAFTPATLSYAISLPAAADHVTLTATPAAGATCTIDGAQSTSHDIAVKPGEAKAVPIVVTAENGFNKTTYTVTVTRAKLDAACQLTGIALAPTSAALTPSFSPAVTAYTVTLPANTGSVTITPAKPEKAKMTINGAASAAATVSLGYGETKTVEIVVTAENGTDKTTYRLTVKRAKPDASKLISLGCSAGSLSPAFDPYKTGYTLTLPKGTGSVTLTPVKAVSSSKLYINGKLLSSTTFRLAVGKSVKVTIKVKSASGATCTYTVTIKR